MPDLSIPDLSFPMVKYGNQETPWDLHPLLYRGGASAKANKVARLITQNALGAPVLERLPLLERLHEVIAGNLTGGGSRHSAATTIEILRKFFSWAEGEEQSLTLETVESTYVSYSDHLLHLVRTVKKLSELTAYNMARTLGQMLDNVLELTAGSLRKTRIRSPRRLWRTRGAHADKQNLEQTFLFGHALLDIVDALSIRAIQGSLPVRIHFRTGPVVEEWSGIRPPDNVKSLSQEPTDRMSRSLRKNAIKARAAYEADTSLRTRHPLVNLRIQAELLIFISQTGMNLAQAHKLRMGKFRYQSHLDGYQVHRVYKGRRQGEVAFEIFSDYRELFERYLKWRDAIFPGDNEGLLFPFVRKGGRSEDQPPRFEHLMQVCKQLNISYFPPRTLRNTRVNWLLRRSRDPSLTAEMAQHTQETLIRVYQEPDLQVAIAEITRFHALTDPALAPPGPGLCVEAVPLAIADAPSEATPPDCISPAGCLYCEHQRDIDSEDHLWSLASYRHLKSLELAQYRPPAKGNAQHPAAAAMDRVTAKLKVFEQSSEVRAVWVREALARVDEEHYHPRWDGFILLMEARQ